MLYGAFMFPTDYAIRPDDLARALEERGFESLWLPEHTHIPVSRRTPYPGGSELPKEYSHTHDPFVALTAAASVTKRLKLCTGICLVIERDPIVTAKQVASLDVLSGGRFLFGVGAGWNAEEMENHGTVFKTRWRLLRERILAMKELWTKPEAEFHGEFVNFDKSWLWPKPLQQPHPPIFLGGDSPSMFDRIVEYGDGWIPIGFRTSNLAEKIQTLRERAAQAGRDPKSVTVSVFGATPDRASLDALAAIGVDRAIFPIAPAGPETVLPLLDRYTALMNG